MDAKTLSANSYRIKYFKDSIIGLKAVLTNCHTNTTFNHQSGIIQLGKGINRFALVLDKPIILNQEKVYKVQLTEDDEIYLIPD